jgi:hypothetical protein
MNPSRVIIDELHAHRDRSLFDVLSLAMGNRGGLHSWWRDYGRVED